MRVEKTWGYEEIIHRGTYTMKLLVYQKAGIASSKHYHEHKAESFYVVSGLFEIEVGDYEIGMTPDGALLASPRSELQSFRPGSAINLPPRTHHRIRCIEPGVIVEASDFDDPEDCVRLIPSET